MIPYLMILIGVVAFIYGVIGLFKIACLPLVQAKQVVFNRNDDYLYYENAKGQRLLKSKKRFLLNIYITLVVVGALLMLTGFYVGFSEHGTDFWLYKKLYSPEEVEGSDRINEEGKEYGYYILIRGLDIYFKDELCADGAVLEERLKGFDRTNTIIVHDDFAVSSAYHLVVDLLGRYGINYVEESN